MLDVKFIWKLVDGDIYEMTFQGYDTLQEAIEDWKLQWNTVAQDCEAFSFSTSNSPVSFDVSHEKG